MIDSTCDWCCWRNILVIRAIFQQHEIAWIFIRYCIHISVAIFFLTIKLCCPIFSSSSSLSSSPSADGLCLCVSDIFSVIFWKSILLYAFFHTWKRLHHFNSPSLSLYLFLSLKLTFNDSHFIEQITQLANMCTLKSMQTINIKMLVTIYAEKCTHTHRAQKKATAATTSTHTQNQRNAKENQECNIERDRDGGKD